MLTYFEVLTVAALSYFARAKVDIVILETGLGGRLDATNAVDSGIAVITPVSFDHTRLLGSTLSQIASEKAGIIKSSFQKVVIAPQEKEVMDIVLDRCREFGIQPVLVNLEDHKDLKIGLKGKHQMVNAATAIEVAGILRTMGFKISDEAIRDGLKHVRWPGRFELLKRDPDVIVDCAHNGASAKALSETLTEEYPHRRVILVLGISEDKDAPAICNSLKKNIAHVLLTKAKHPRAHSFVAAECKDYFGDKSFEIIEDLPKALDKALQMASSEDVIIVAGSVFVVAEAMNYFQGS
jgi:dihydrofolate synthase/folylpolyglutamate synthase